VGAGAEEQAASAAAKKAIRKACLEDLFITPAPHRKSKQVSYLASKSSRILIYPTRARGGGTSNLQKIPKNTPLLRNKPIFFS